MTGNQPGSTKQSAKRKASTPSEFQAETVLGIDRYGFFCHIVELFGDFRA